MVITKIVNTIIIQIGEEKMKLEDLISKTKVQKKNIMFLAYDLDYEENMYTNIFDTVILEKITKGRFGANLINDVENIPIVRTTTKYQNPNQLFSDIHYRIMNDIKKSIRYIYIIQQCIIRNLHKSI